MAKKMQFRGFISYSHKDDKYLDYFMRFKSHSQHELNVFDDTQLFASQDWHQTIQSRIADADFAILLLSTSFFSSEYIKEKELANFINQRQNGDFFIVFPVLLAPFSFEREETVNSIQFFAPNGKDYGNSALKKIPFNYLFRNTDAGNTIPKEDYLFDNYMFELCKQLDTALNQLHERRQAAKENLEKQRNNLENQKKQLEIEEQEYAEIQQLHNEKRKQLQNDMDVLLQIENLKLQITAKEKEISVLQANIKTLQSDNNQAIKTIESKEKEISELQNKIKVLQNDNNQSLKIGSEKENEIANQKNEVKKLQSDNMELYEFLKEEQQKITILESKLAKIENERLEKQRIAEEAEREKERKRIETEKNGNITWQDEKNGTFIDPRDQHKYKVVKIGNQIWFAENLAYKANSGCWAYEDKVENAAKYGYLYDWETACKVVPKGWHLPSDEEWKQMEIFLGMSKAEADKSDEWRGEGVGTKLKSTSDWYNNGNGTNVSGFNALPSGYRYTDGTFYNVPTSTNFWSSSPDGQFAWIRDLNYGYSTVRRRSYSPAYGFSVRCLRD